MFRFALKLLSTALFGALLCTSVSAQSNKYDALREQLKPKPPTESFIATTKLDSDEGALTLKEQEDEIRKDCRANRNAARCQDYHQLFDPRQLNDICEQHPLDERCTKSLSSKFNNMIKRQTACHDGMDSRNCRVARVFARRSGLIPKAPTPEPLKTP